MQICFYCFYTNSSSANFSSYFYALEVLISYLKKKQTWISLHQNKLTFPHRQVRMSIINQVKISQWDQSLFKESISKYFSKPFVRCTKSKMGQLKETSLNFKECD